MRPYRDSIDPLFAIGVVKAGIAHAEWHARRQGDRLAERPRADGMHAPAHVICAAAAERCDTLPDIIGVDLDMPVDAYDHLVSRLNQRRVEAGGDDEGVSIRRR